MTLRFFKAVLYSLNFGNKSTTSPYGPLSELCKTQIFRMVINKARPIFVFLVRFRVKTFAIASGLQYLSGHIGARYD